ncbi:hypothetical protein PPL_00184 [Heterostelium album PN500]|uniref:Uncharacterized protein n=1 Tax=Heterostelium pallidum (strain ATCC 26659 / Pp 5 / PN500) TaxID=670386 RepID=D3AVR9_HETP5|nr:hypothetical protein PPL_00184 [Heterostelium album PN500]EFA86392.1 hypothetical protein PPL_00184 [Heterostelium album PN500]|eukprot:XP_020438497.1 hypothetical protein PPL_00184 [Heterostelium album PN500]
MTLIENLTSIGNGASMVESISHSVTMSGGGAKSSQTGSQLADVAGTDDANRFGRRYECYWSRRFHAWICRRTHW